MNNINTSDIARIRERIALEYQASQRIFTDFTPTASHEYITHRQENIEACFHELTQYMSSQDAMRVLIQIEQDVYGCSSVSGNTS